MRIAVGADHAGYELKSHLRAQLEAAGHAVLDLGTHSSESVDYPDFGRAVGLAVVDGEAELGVIVCGTGIGISIAANRVRGVRAARCTSEFDARLARQHNDGNVIAFGARITAKEHAWSMVQEFLATPFDGGRHSHRVEKLDLPVPGR